VQLRFLALPLAALALGFGLSRAADAPKKKAAPDTKAPAQKSTVARKAAATKVAPRATATTAANRGRYTATPARPRTTTTYARRGRSPQPVPVRRYYGQQAPTSDRYMEIQQALITRGFLQTPPSGSWDPATIDALKRFQEEQNLPPTGKISSLSLIALGLGPKRTPLTSTTTQTQPVP
jgi:hypothetical protein